MDSARGVVGRLVLFWGVERGGRLSRSGSDPSRWGWYATEGALRPMGGRGRAVSGAIGVRERWVWGWRAGNAGVEGGGMCE